MQRVIDCLIAVTGLVILAPLMLLVAIAIKLDSQGPVLFKQERIGRHLKPFSIYKFRTMSAGAEKRGPLTVRDDPRVTRLGAFLRDTKLDELPQLLNVLRGDMSLVGPRPELARYVRLFPDEFREILKVRPGITDPASIAYRHESSLLSATEDPESKYVREILPDKLRLARIYVDHPSLGHALRLVLETLMVLSYPARFLDRLFEGLARHRVVTDALAQGTLAAAAHMAALFLRYDGAPPAEIGSVAGRALPVIALIRCAWLWPFNLHRDVWQYVGLSELGAIVASVALGTGTIWLALHAPALAGYPPSVLILDGLLCVVALSGVRIVRRLHGELREKVLASRRIVIVGVDDSTESMLRELMSHPRHDYRIVGLVSGDRSTLGLRIHNVPIVGCYDQLEEILGRTSPDETFIVASAVPEGRLRELIRRCRGSGRPVKLLPDLADILKGKEPSPHPELYPVDELLFREPVQFDLERLGQSLRGRRIMVTGAGGSIGSEICRQVAACRPAGLVMFEKHEASLFHIEREIRRLYPEVTADAFIGDVRDSSRIDEILEATRPELIFHAAAYKHVPMMERNPWEAVKTNALGTKILTEAADRFGVGTFVLISTDKAVEPTCVMGASKRMAELILQWIAPHSRTRFLTVRFGNVLDSSGSVIPLFREQIERGGPVTVTHARATRWFMTVPEAVQLILEAQTLGRGGEVFVLDMGKPVRILDLACSLIRQRGLRPGKDVPIEFTGLRPGERLFERLFNDHEMVWKTPHPRILMAAETNGNGHGQGRRAEEFRRLIRRIQAAAGEGPAPDLEELADRAERLYA